MMRNMRNSGEVKNGALYGGFNRLRDFPLDASSIVNTKEELREYLYRDATRHSIAYIGQIIGVRETGEIIVVKALPEINTPVVDIDVYVKSMSTTDDIKIFKEEFRTETQQYLKDNYATKDQLNAEIDKILKDNDTELLDSFKEVREKFESTKNEVDAQFEKVQKWIKENESSIGKIDDIDVLRTELTTLRNEFKVVEANYATDDELSDAIAKAIKDLLGKHVQDITDAAEKIQKISEWIELHSEDFENLDVLTNELKVKLAEIQAAYTAEMAGIRETQAAQDKALNSLNTTTAAHQTLIEQQGAQIAETVEKINDAADRIEEAEKKIAQAESKLENLSGDYVTKEELESLVGNIDISGVEKAVVLNFGYAGEAAIYNRMKDTIPAGSIIREVQVLFEKVAQPLAAEPIENGLFISIQQGDVKSHLITYNMIDDEVVTDAEQLPETFIYHLNKFVDTDSKIVVEPVNFINSAGRVFVKFYQN